MEESTNNPPAAEIDSKHQKAKQEREEVEVEMEVEAEVEGFREGRGRVEDRKTTTDISGNFTGMANPM